MKTHSSLHFYSDLENKFIHFPMSGLIELTYRCNLNCIHCYCKGSEDRKRELTTAEFKKILDELHNEGCLSLQFSGGDPLLREDFLEIYSYAKKKGFIITIFTNGILFNQDLIDYLAKSPPFSVEITLNGITKDTYESITQVKGSFAKVIENIKKLKEKKISLIIKTNCLKQNKHELGKIKRWTKEILNKSDDNKSTFRYDPVINPRLNKDKTPCDYRLSMDELVEIRKQDLDIWKEYKNCLDQVMLDRARYKNFLYHCNTWAKHFFINPYGRLKFCQFSEKFSIDLKTESFKEGFYKKFLQVLNEKFKTNSKCRDCDLRPICCYCPARAYLETGDEESPIEYYCNLAKETARQIKHYQKIDIRNLEKINECQRL